MDDASKHIYQLREDFTKGSLSESDVDLDPAKQFSIWFTQAIESKIPEVQAMHLSSVSSQGKPSGRIVYLREFEANNFWFYTNYQSKKANDFITNPLASLTFFWPDLERQIRIEGSVEKASEANNDAYFNARPYESKLGAWASQQSQRLSSRAELEKQIEELKKEMSPTDIKRPPFWGGYIFKADSYEFWQGRKSRLHDRICYQLKDNIWEIFRLAP